MAALSLAVIGKNNEPLYMKQFRDTKGQQNGDDDDDDDDEYYYDITEEDLFLSTEKPNDQDTSSLRKTTVGGFECSARHQFILHSALDRFEQLAGPIPSLGWRKPGVSGTDGMFVGLLCPVEEMRVYGYYTTTKIMFLLVVEDDAVPELQQNVDSEIKSLLIKIHQLYIEDLLNPFMEIGSPITSQRFNDRVDRLVAGFNQSDGMI